MSNYFYYVLFTLLLTTACSAEQKPNNIEQTVAAYYQVYQERKDFQRFLDFYAEDMVLEDIIFGERMVGKTEFANFFDWDNPNFSKKDSIALIIQEQVIGGNEVVTKGYFTPFSWKDNTFPAMYFTTWLTFNKNGKIVKHVDWINYPNELIDYAQRKDSNDWLKGKE